MGAPRKKNDNETVFWISFADLSTSLMMCFMIIFLCVTYISAIDRNTYKDLKSKLAENQKRGVEITESIRPVLAAKQEVDRALESVKKISQVLIDTKECEGVSDFRINPEDLSLTIEFKKGNLSWFKVSRSEPEPAGKSCLRAFVPLWLGELYKLHSARSYVEQLVIEGHTDSSAGKEGDPFLYNLKLSQDRSLEVAKFILNPDDGIGVDAYKAYGEITSQWAPFRQWLNQHLTATGRSFSKLKYVESNGSRVEDADKSRRVEFKIVLKDQLRVIEKIMTDSAKAH